MRNNQINNNEAFENYSLGPGEIIFALMLIATDKKAQEKINKYYEEDKEYYRERFAKFVNTSPSTLELVNNTLITYSYDVEKAGRRYVAMFWTMIEEGITRIEMDKLNDITNSIHPRIAHFLKRTSNEEFSVSRFIEHYNIDLKSEEKLKYCAALFISKSVLCSFTNNEPEQWKTVAEIDYYQEFFFKNYRQIKNIRKVVCVDFSVDINDCWEQIFTSANRLNWNDEKIKISSFFSIFRNTLYKENINTLNTFFRQLYKELDKEVSNDENNNYFTAFFDEMNISRSIYINRQDLPGVFNTIEQIPIKKENIPGEVLLCLQSILSINSFKLNAAMLTNLLFIQIVKDAQAEQLAELKDRLSEIEQSTIIIEETDTASSKTNNLYEEKYIQDIHSAYTSKIIEKDKAILNQQRENNTLLKQIEKLKEELEKEKMKNRQQLNQTPIDKTVEEEIDIDTMINVINESQLKILIVGGYDNTNAKLEKLLKYATFTYKDDKFSDRLIANNDLVFINTSFTSHHIFYKVQTLTDRFNMELNYLNNTNVKNNIQSIYEIVSKESY